MTMPSGGIVAPSLDGTYPPIVSREQTLTAEKYADIQRNRKTQEAQRRAAALAAELIERAAMWEMV